MYVYNVYNTYIDMHAYNKSMYVWKCVCVQ